MSLGIVADLRLWTRF